MSKPKMPKPIPAPAPPPPPVKKVKKLNTENKRATRKATKRRGTASLTVQRPTINTGTSGGTGVNY